MAVYTHLGAEDLAELIAEFDVGELRSAKGIAEGVSNSNWLIETSGRDGTGSRFILTMYEFRIDIAELPYFLGLLDHLAARGCPVPRTIHDRTGALYRHIGDKAVALIEYLPGVSVSHPTAGQARAVGSALARLHRAAADYPASRANGMDLAESERLAQACTPEGLAEIDPAQIEDALRQYQRPARSSSCRSQIKRAACGVISATLQRASTASSMEEKPLALRSRVRLRFKIARRSWAGTSSSGWLSGPSPSSMISRSTCSGNTPA